MFTEARVELCLEDFYDNFFKLKKIKHYKAKGGKNEASRKL